MNRFSNTKFARFLILAFALVIGFAVLSDNTYAKASSSLSNDYIKSKCTKNCIDPDLLRLAAFEAGKEFGVNPLTLIAIAGVESSYKAKAINKVSGKSVGLMQVQVFWHKDKFQSKNHFDVFDNVRVGAIVYSDCTKRWKGSREKALWCYNGHTRSGMKTYVPKVQAEIKRLSAFF